MVLKTIDINFIAKDIVAGKKNFVSMAIVTAIIYLLLFIKNGYLFAI